MSSGEEPNIYDEIEIEDMTFDSTLQIYHYPCPCGDRFEVALCDLRDGEDIAICPGCSLMIKVIFEAVSPPGQLYIKQSPERSVASDMKLMHATQNDLPKEEPPKPSENQATVAVAA